MTYPTHIAWASVVYLYICTMFKVPLVFWDAFVCGIASLLPDLDLSSSGIGRRLPFISTRIEKKFGHRTITHSFVGVFIISFLALPLLFKSISCYGTFVLGYWSHIFIDFFNKEGVQIYWPNRKWGVFPAKAENRIAVGSTAENILLVGLIAVACLSIPLHLLAWTDLCTGSLQTFLERSRTTGNVLPTMKSMQSLRAATGRLKRKSKALSGSLALQARTRLWW